jgi:hypothetical protein
MNSSGPYIGGVLFERLGVRGHSCDPSKQVLFPPSPAPALSFLAVRRAGVWYDFSDPGECRRIEAELKAKYEDAICDVIEKRSLW